MTRPGLPQQLRRHQSRFDLALALLLGAAAVLITSFFGETGSGEDHNVDVWGLGLVALAFAPLAVRRRRPLVALAITAAASTAYLLAGYPYGPILIAYFIAVYTVATLLPLKTAAISVTASLVVLLTHIFVHPNALEGWLGLIAGSAWGVVPFAIGTSVRSARQTREAARAEAIRLQLYEERIRLAQEVHDVVGHGLAAIQMQADVALHVDEEQPSRTRSALEAISRASSEAFEELRSTLDVIGEQRDRRTPAPSLGDIEELCDRIRSAGVSVDLSIEGDQSEVSAAVGLAVYRIVQESLTNVIRHGTVPSAAVHVKLHEEIIDLRVSNPGPVTPDRGPGYGLAGMSRRVRALDGTFDAGPSDQGFEVHARIPASAGR